MFGRRKRLAERPNKNQLLESVLDHGFDAIYSKDLRGKITSWNKAAERMYGYTQKEALGRSVEMLMPKGHDDANKILKDILAGRSISGYQTARLTKNGEEIQVELSVSAIKDEQHKITGASIIARDISQKLDTIRDLNETKDRFTLATESAKIGIWEWDIRLNSLVWDSRMYKLYGANPKNFSGAYEAWVRGLHKDDKSRTEEELKKAIRNKKMFDSSFRVVLPNGVVRYIRAFGKSICDRDGAVIKMVGVNWDITNETENIKSIERFKLAVDAAYDHIIICDEHGRIIYANSAAVKTTGYSIEEMLGNTPSLWGRQMPKEFYEKMWDTISVKKKPFVGEVTNCRKSGEIYIAEAHISPILSDLGDKVEYYLGVERDITKLKEIDKSKTEFVSLASHQLRTPLSAVNWYAELLLDKATGPLSPIQKGYLHEIYAGNQRMVALVNTLLNVSRLELGTFSYSPKNINPKAILDQLLKELKVQIVQSNISINRNSSKEPEKYYADQELFQMILQNLISNAVKYTPTGGQVTISMEMQKNTLHIEIEDTGRGIPANQKEKIFSKLFRADNVQVLGIEGTGLGLYIVKSVVDQSGGSITFNSRLNKGTTFMVDLPKSGMQNSKLKIVKSK